MNARQTIGVAGISGALAVGIGAMGAHALNDFLIRTDHLGTFETAVQFQFYHTLLLFGIGILMIYWKSKALTVAAWSSLIGILLFSGSLYFLVWTGNSWLGAITPLGGMAFIISWLALAYAAYHRP